MVDNSHHVLELQSVTDVVVYPQAEKPKPEAQNAHKSGAGSVMMRPS